MPTGLPPSGMTAKKTQYSGWHKDTTGEDLLSGEDNEVPQRNRYIWGNIDFIEGWLD